MPPIRLLPEAETLPQASARPMMFDIKDKNQLYSFYMPFLKNGGLFMPTKVHISPGTKLSILLSLPDDKMKKTVTGKVSWITPADALMGLAQGVGVHFEDNEQNRLLKTQIENALAGILGHSETRTMTL